MNAIRAKDVNDGLQSEVKLLPLLNKFLDTELKQNSKWAICDFENDDYSIELKKRNNNYSTYPTTMIGQNKIEYMKLKLSQKKKCYLVFDFLDGVYYIKLDDDNLEKLKQNEGGGRNDREKNEYKNKGYCYININLLSKINN